VYLRDFKRILADSGKVFLTAFIENNVPDMTINPQDYIMTWEGPLHCVRYSKDFFESLISEVGFVIEKISQKKETDGQAALYLA